MAALQRQQQQQQQQTPSHPQWHEGELEMHRLLRIPGRSDNPTSAGLPARYGYRVAASPLMALGTLDSAGRPWVTVVGGENGFVRPVAQDFLAMKAVVDVGGLDGVIWEMLADEGDEMVLDKVVRPEGGKLMAGLAIDLETRDRVKIAGRMVAGSMTGYQTATDGGTEVEGVSKAGEVQIAFHILETLGNCPKYLNKKHITPHVPAARLAYQAKRDEVDGVQLPETAKELVDKADMFFIASRHGTESMDVNHRGGAPGFMRVVTQQQGQDTGKKWTTLIYPELSGNNLFQTLGNLRRDPQVGICVPDYDTGDVLYVTGTAEVLIGDAAMAYLPRTKLAVKVDVEECRFVKAGLGFRGAPIDHSPYNPPVRYLTSEKHDVSASQEAMGGGVAVAKLEKREKITDTVSRYTFSLKGKDKSKELDRWHPGQYVTLGFEEELDNGWRHMADDDPQSLNDDYVRSFTISAPIEHGAKPDKFEITVRRHGPVTALLGRWNMRVPLEVPVLGFGGDEEFRMPGASGRALAADELGGSDKDSVFLAQGVGITPLMAQAPGVIKTVASGATTGKFRLLWALRAEDVLFAEDVFARIPALAQVTTLFVTGKPRSGTSGVEDERALEAIQELGTKVVEGRMGKDDVLTAGEKGRRKYYGCMSGIMRKALMEWTAEEELVVESFDY